MDACPARPDFSGRWRFDPAASALEIPTPDAVVFVIDHREPTFRLSRALTISGRTDTFAIDLTIGADNPPFARGETTLYPAIHWDGDDLVFPTRIVHGSDEASNHVRYHLEGDGSVLVATERLRGAGLNYDNRWVFTREAGTSR